MKKVYQIVLYTDKWSIHKVLETKLLFENENVAIMIADKICKEKKMYFTLKEFYL